MARQTAIDLVEQFATNARGAGMGVLGVVLYGSFARGDAHEWSDIDVVALLSDTMSDREVWETEVDLNMLAHKLDTRFEILAVRESEFLEGDLPVVDAARSEGIRIAA